MLAASAASLSACAGPDAAGAGPTGSTAPASAAGGPAAATAPRATPADVVDRAAELLATLTDDDRSRTVLARTPGELTRWPAEQGAGGLAIRDLAPTQRAAFDALAQAAYGTAPGEGADELRQLLALESAGPGDAEPISVAFLGQPTMTGEWTLRVTGPGLVMTSAYRNGGLAGGTPSLRTTSAVEESDPAAQPRAPELAERDALAAVVASLDADQRAQALIPGARTGVELGPGRDWAFPAVPQGVVVSSFTPAQHDLVTAALATIVGDLDDAAAEWMLTEYGKQIDGTYLAYTGAGGLDAPGDSIRLDGPRVWVELVVEAGVDTGPARTVILWRDKVSDYGGKPK